MTKPIDQWRASSGRMIRDNGVVLNHADYLYKGKTPLNETKTVLKRHQLILSNVAPLSERRDEITETNNGTVAKTNGEYALTATTDTNSRAILATQQYGEYEPANILEPGIGIRIPVQPTGDAYIRWGYYTRTDQQGFYMEYTANGLFFVIHDGSQEKARYAQSNWNQNLSITLDLTKGNVFQFPFLYYGYGPIMPEIGLVVNDTYDMEIVHSHNTNGGLVFPNPNKPITAEVNSGTTGVELVAYVAGRQISTYGQTTPTERDVSDYRSLSGIGTTILPLISVRHTTGNEHILCKLAEVDIISDADLIYYIIRNATLTGASYSTASDVTSSESITEWDISATAISGGDVVKKGLIQGGQKGTIAREDLPQRPLNAGEPYTLAVKRVTGTNASATALFSISERW